jgi:hypothetical protein
MVVCRSGCPSYSFRVNAPTEFSARHFLSGRELSLLLAPYINNPLDRINSSPKSRFVLVPEGFHDFHNHFSRERSTTSHCNQAY